MDYIALPKSSFGHVRVRVREPLYVYDPRKFEDFSTFPSRHGFLFDDATDLVANWAQLSNDDSIRLFQSWFFFGTLAEYFGTTIDYEDFISRDKSDPSVAHLNVVKLKFQQESDITDRLQSILLQTWTALESLEKGGHLSSPIAGQTGLAIRLLVIGIYSLHKDPRVPHTWNCGWLRNEMTQKNWCPQQVESIFNSQDILVAYYLSRLRRPNATGISHSGCTNSKCIANNVDISTHYKSRHANQNCYCKFLRVDEAKVKAIVQGGGIPLIRLTRTKDGRTGLKVIEASPRSSYTAISHVWCDGLGNPRENSLPQCQVDLLAETLKVWDEDEGGSSGLAGQVAVVDFDPFGTMIIDLAKVSIHWANSPVFWMDTLCIPVGNEPGIEKLKLKAINRMAAIYTGATRVMVLDSDIQQLCLSTSTTTEVFARIAYSTWMRRCWTLQEGALARVAWFQCVDGLVNPLTPDYEAKFKGIRGTVDAHIRRRIHDACITSLDIVSHGNPAGILDLHEETEDIETAEKMVASQKHGQLRQLCAVWNNLAIRSTTKAEDIHAIFANLLEFSSYYIMELPIEDRLRAMLYNLNSLPLSLLFNTGPRLQPHKNHTDRWVPTFPSPCTLDAEHHLTVNENSLSYTYSPGGSVFLVEVDLDIVKGHTTFVIDLPTGKGIESSTYAIEMNRDQNDQMCNSSSFQKGILILHNWGHDDKIGLGACLFAYMPDHGEGATGSAGPSNIPQIKTRYHCPLNWRGIVRIGQKMSVALAKSRPIDSEREIRLDCGKLVGAYSSDRS
jgi:hypothetical protein